MKQSFFAFLSLSALALVPVSVYAAGELKAVAAPGKAVYAEILSPSGQVWNGTAFETETDANWANYKVALTQQGAGQVYVGSMPAGITAAGRYSVVIYQQAGASPSPADLALQQSVVDWTGAAVASEGVNTLTLGTTLTQATTAATQSTTAAAQATTAATQSTTAAAQATSAATGTANNGVTLALLKSGQILGTGTVTAATTPTATAFSTTLTATPDLISGDGLIFTSGVNAGKNIHILTNSAGLFGLPGTGLPAAPSAGDTFVLIPFSKALTTFTASLGTDSRPLLSSSDTQAGAETASTLTTYGAAKTADVTGLGATLNGTLATITAQTNSSTRQADMTSALTQQGYTVTRATKLDGIGGAVASVTGPVGSVGAPVSLASADEAALGLLPGISTTAAKLTFDPSGILYVDAKTLPATAPAGYGGGLGGTASLSLSDEAKLTLASTAQQSGQPVTLPSAVLSQADILAVQQAIMTYALHTGVSYQKAMAQIYLNTAGAVTPSKSGTVQTNPFVWPDGATGLTSTLDSSTGKRTETGGTLPN